MPHHPASAEPPDRADSPTPGGASAHPAQHPADQPTQHPTQHPDEHPPQRQAEPQIQRQSLRHELLAQRKAFASTADFASAQHHALQHLATTLAQLEPSCLGLYWPLQGEFNPAPVVSMLQKAAGVDDWAQALTVALPFAWRGHGRMAYRRWDGKVPSLRDECGIPTADGPDVVPDVVLVPCVGYTRSGYRLGYGGGYFDRWLAAHPQATAIGLAWSGGEVSAEQFAPDPHDCPLMGIVTELAVVGD